MKQFLPCTNFYYSHDPKLFPRSGRALRGQISSNYMRRAIRKRDDMDQPSEKSFLDRIVFSDREEEVLKYLVLGHSDKEIARHIDVSPRTVGRYVDIVRFKLRAKNRAHVVTRAINAGFLKLV